MFPEFPIYFQIFNCPNFQISKYFPNYNFFYLNFQIYFEISIFFLQISTFFQISNFFQIYNFFKFPFFPKFPIFFPSKFPTFPAQISKFFPNFSCQISNCQFSISICISQLKYKLLGFVDAQVLCILKFCYQVLIILTEMILFNPHAILYRRILTFLFGDLYHGQK